MSRTLPRPILGKGKSLASIALMRSVFQTSGATHRARAGITSLRQRNELVLLRNRSEAAGFPVLFGLLDPLLAGGDEIPPDMARALQCVAAQKHHPGRLERLHGDAVAWAEYEQARAFIALIGDLDFAVDEIDRPLLVIGVERHAGASIRRDLGVEPGRD